MCEGEKYFSATVFRIPLMIMSTASSWRSCRQPPRGDPWKLSSPLKQMSTPRECSWGGKRIDLQPRKRKIPDANFNYLNFVENLPWSEWSPWSSCTTTCRNETRVRFRECLGFLQDGQPANCSGSALESSACSNESCKGKASIC